MMGRRLDANTEVIQETIQEVCRLNVDKNFCFTAVSRLSDDDSNCFLYNIS